MLRSYQRHKGTDLNCCEHANSTHKLEAKPRGTPWDSHLVEDREPLEEPTIMIYRRILGQLMYLSNATRPDLAFTVGRLASGMQKPSRGQWGRMKRVLRYLNGTRNMGIRYTRYREHLSLEAYADASFGFSSDTGKSITGY